MQHGFTNSNRMTKVTEEIHKLLESKVFDIVIATRFLNGDNSVYEKLFNWKNLKTEKECALVKGYEQYVDYISDKSIYTCINPNFMQKVCQLNGGNYPEEIFLAGVDTDCCVLATATSLFESNIRPIVLTKYCDSNGGIDYHKAGLLCLKRLIGTKQLVDKEIVTKEDLNIE